MSVRIGVLSDTHDRLSADTLSALKGCSCILHAGDVTIERILDQLRPLGRIYVVRGNNDYGMWAAGLQRRLSFEIEGVRFVMTHERFRAGDCQGADVIIYGHTHQYRLEHRDGQIWLNPGSCELPRYGNGRTLAILTISEGKVTDIRKVCLD